MIIGTLGGKRSPSEPPVVTRPSEKFSLYLSAMRAGYKSPPMATIVMPLPPVNVVKNADATRQTIAKPPGIHPSQARDIFTRRLGVPLSANT